MHKLLVYGTLRQGGPTVKIKARLYDLGWFPGVVLHDEADGPEVVCEELEVDDSKLAQMDYYEGHNVDNPDSSFFKRTLLESGQFIYVPNFSAEEGTFVESGDWLQHNPDGFKKKVS